MGEGSEIPQCGAVSGSMDFTESTKYTLGVEIELQTLDKTSWELAPLAPQLLASAPAILSRRLSPEFIQKW